MIPCNRLTTSEFLSELPSMILFIGLENQYENSFLERKMYGIKKCNRDQSSIKLFCMIVVTSVVIARVVGETIGVRDRKRSGQGKRTRVKPREQQHVCCSKNKLLPYRFSLTCNGVPVNNNRRCVLKLINVCHR